MALTFKKIKNYAKISKSCCFKSKKKENLGLTKGYFGARKNVWTVAKNTWEKGLTYAYRDRKNKKRNFRALWIQQRSRTSGGDVILSVDGSFAQGRYRNQPQGACRPGHESS